MSSSLSTRPTPPHLNPIRRGFIWTMTDKLAGSLLRGLPLQWFHSHSALTSSHDDDDSEDTRHETGGAEAVDGREGEKKTRGGGGRPPS